MKSTFPHRTSTVAIFAVALFGLAPIPTASAGPLNKASGKYDGKISGFARIPFFGTERLPKTKATLKLPTGEGRVVIKVKGFERTAGKITMARVRQGGDKVVLIGRTKIPKALTGKLGVSSITGPFKAVVDLSGAKPAVRATTTLKKLGATAKAVFTGSQ